MSKHIVCTLDIGYSKDVTDITLPAMSKYASNIEADFIVITERKYPDLPITQEKFQLYDLKADHITFLDVDALINPDAIDFSKNFADMIVIAECLAANDFASDSPPGKNKFRVHSAFLSFSDANRFIVKPHKNPLQYVSQILGDNQAWHLDEYIMSLNILKHGADILDLKVNFTNTIAHDGNYLTLNQKVKFLKKNQSILKQKELLHYD